mmetsp:Transcript_95170/g.308157  ORF Transcript_95170/g.308157 Transcript_95170/m.308157 type:complete len:240 (-) Transcript_95170:459-1178(-)
MLRSSTGQFFPFASGGFSNFGHAGGNAGTTGPNVEMVAPCSEPTLVGGAPVKEFSQLIHFVTASSGESSALPPRNAVRKALAMLRAEDSSSCLIQEVNRVQSSGLDVRAPGPGPKKNSSSSSRKKHAARKAIPKTLSGYFAAYANARQEPQEPPETTHFSWPRCSRNFSRSSTNDHVVLSSSWSPELPVRRLLPQPRWSISATLYTFGSNNCAILLEHPAPGPPCKKTAGTPVALPCSS